MLWISSYCMHINSFQYLGLICLWSPALWMDVAAGAKVATLAMYSYFMHNQLYPQAGVNNFCVATWLHEV